MTITRGPNTKVEGITGDLLSRVNLEDISIQFSFDVPIESPSVYTSTGTPS